MVLGNFNSLNLRPDTGALWDNFLISERHKQNTYKSTYTKMYFWRTKQQQEVDLIEEKNGIITGFKFKWHANKKQRLPKTFVNEYHALEEIVDRSNFRNFVTI